MTRCLLAICVFSLTLGRLFPQDSGKLNSRFRKTIASYNAFLYLCTSNPKKASLVPKVGLNRRLILVLIDDRRRSSMTTKIRARNGASGTGTVESRIMSIRGNQIMIDRNLAELYGVETKRQSSCRTYQLKSLPAGSVSRLFIIYSFSFINSLPLQVHS